MSRPALHVARHFPRNKQTQRAPFILHQLLGRPIMLLNWRKCEKEGKTHFKFDQCMGEWGACVVTSLLKPKNTFFITLFSLLQSQSVLFYFCIITRLNIRVCDFFKIVHNLNIEARSSCVLSVCAFFCINIMKRTTSHILRGVQCICFHVYIW